jgi:hypothetical protein
LNLGARRSDRRSTSRQPKFSWIRVKFSGVFKIE